MISQADGVGSRHQNHAAGQQQIGDFTKAADQFRLRGVNGQIVIDAHQDVGAIDEIGMATLGEKGFF